LAFGGALAYLTLAMHAITPRVFLATPLLLACGLWMIVFGYPKRQDGLAPAWWRLGLVATATVFFALTCVIIDV
jgi:hypothetical protein